MRVGPVHGHDQCHCSRSQATLHALENQCKGFILLLWRLLHVDGLLHTAWPKPPKAPNSPAQLWHWPSLHATLGVALQPRATEKLLHVQLAANLDHNKDP